MPNLRSKTWTTTTPATVEDAQHWEDHLVSDATLNSLEAAKHTHSNKTVLDSLTKDSDGDLNFEGSKINGVSDSFGHVKVGSTTIDASGDDTVEFIAGSNVTLSTSGKTVTINASGGGSGTSTGDMLKSEFVLAGGTGQVLSAKKADSVGTATTSVLEKFSEDSSGKPTYNGSAIGGGQGGSVLYVSTTSFIGYTVSVSITDTVTGITETASTTFGSNGKASFNLVSIGVATISVVDSGTTYSSTCSITCYSVYEAPAINRFSATINVTAKCGSDVVSGAEIIVNGSASGKTTNSSGVANVTVSEKGSYIIEIKKDGVISSNKSTVSITSETTRTCIVNIARIKYSFSGALSATITGSSFTKTINTNESPYYLYVPSLQTYSLSGTLGEFDVSATTSVSSYDEFSTTVAVFNSTINVSTVSGAVVTATSGTDIFTATAAAGVASITVRKAATYTVSAKIDNVTSEDTKTVTISASGETKTASVAFASIKLTFDGALIASVAKGTFTKQINTSTSPYTFYVSGIGTYTLNGTLAGKDVESEIVVSSYSETEAEIKSGFDFEAWLTAGGVTQTFVDLDAVLADEKTVRRLMTVHASADFMIEALETDTDLSDALLASDNALKWIGLRDYTYDKLPSAFITSWLSGSKWEYALKDHVPVMTANNAPYGEASAYQIFDNNSGTSASGTDFSYKFTNPICIIKFNSNIDGGTLQVSDDGSTWFIADNKYHLYARIHYVASVTLHTLQFYGRTLNVSVPSMTDNTTPYGVVSESNPDTNKHYIGGLTMQSGGAWVFFDKTHTDVSNDRYASNTPPNYYIEYKFPNNVVVKYFEALNNFDGASWWNNKFEIMASKDGTIGSFVSLGVYERESGNLKMQRWVIDNDEPYQYYRYYNRETSVGHNISNASGTHANFYGLDYSEREFEENSKVEYVYDHGVKIVEIDKTEIGSSTVTEGNNSILINNADTSSTANIKAFTNDSLDTTNYKLVRCILGSNISNLTNGLMLTLVNNSGDYNRKFETTTTPYHNYQDIENVNGSHTLELNAGSTIQTGKIELYEWWIERK